MSAEDFSTKTYDYVICGGGTAGLAVAARLSEDPNVTVAVLEAGGNGLNDVMIDAPNLFMQLWGNPQYDWDYKTVPQKGTNGSVHGWVRGKILGGSSAVNFEMFSMASRQDLDNWEQLGNKGWGFDSMLPYYRKFETYHPAEDAFSAKVNDKYIDASLRGTSGPIQISFPGNETTWIQDVWPKTILNAGYDPSKDPRSGSAIGGFNQLNTVDPKHVRRSYAARDYYEPASTRSNLSVLTHALVSKVQLEKTGDEVQATGVEFIVESTKHAVKAKKEVIICGGTINSPQILELSGIGYELATTNNFGVKDEYPTVEALVRNPEMMQQAMEAYLQHKSGPFAAAPTTTGFTSLEKIQPDFPDAEQHIKALVAEHAKKHPHADLAGRDELLARQLLDPKEAVAQIVTLAAGLDVSQVHTASKLFVSPEPGMWAALGACSTRSLSRGSVHITSSDPSSHSAIDPAYFQHPLDLDMMARAILHCITFTEIEPLKSIFRRDEHGELIVAKSGGPLPKTLEEAKEYVRKNTVTEYHPTGTCAMLPRDKGGVIDSELKVYGTKNLRVVDASIFPTPVQGNIVSLVYALSEKAADIIKAAGKAGGANGTNGASH
ncbi:hypothetical protein ACEQ8H_002595 [Pleosporales sp. CAS-2024a]